jgi:amino acid adenylation domain-containing protein
MLRAYVARDQATWLLLLHQHHLTSDHTTLDIVQAEVRARLSGRMDELPAAVPFRTFVAQARLGVTVAEHEEFFRAQLGDVNEPTAPFGLLDVQGDGAAVSEARLGFEPALSNRLRARARALSVSTASLCHVAWAQVLARVSGRTDVVFGTVLFGRMQGGAGTDRALGLFINTLPVRMCVDHHDAVSAVQAMHRQLAELLRHEHASLALAQRCSGVRAPTPLFSALLNYRHGTATTREAEESATASMGGRRLASEERTNYPVTLSVNDWGHALGVTAQVVAPLDPGQVCALMQQALTSLVEALEHAPATPVDMLAVLPPDERTRVVEAWNATARPYPTGGCVHELFEAQAGRTPDAIAVVDGDRLLSYAALNARANQVARRLRALGVGPETRVAVCLERSLELVVALFGILKAGGAYVPLDPSYPVARLRHILEESAPAVLLLPPKESSQAPWHADLSALSTRLGGCPLNLEWLDSVAGVDAADLPRALTTLSPTHAAYVIYTSGSTGRAKGVINHHGGVVNRLMWMQEQYGLTAAEAVLQKTPVSFDVSVWELFWPGMVGARLVLARPDGHRDPDYLARVIHEAEITTLHFVPSMLEVFAAPPNERACPGVRRVVCSGEALSATVARAARGVFPAAELHNLYGPTEAAVDVTAWACPAVVPDRIPIGRPIANTRLFVLDRRGEPVPTGVTGEVYIGGVQVARGYLRQPGLTAERFIPDPYGPAGSRLYRTGDLGRWMAGGVLDYLGRVDHQVKIRGHRIDGSSPTWCRRRRARSTSSPCGSIWRCGYRSTWCRRPMCSSPPCR